MFLLITQSNNSQCSLDANSNIMRFPVATKGSWTAAGIFDHFSVGLFGSSRFLSSLQRGVLPSEINGFTVICGVLGFVEPEQRSSKHDFTSMVESWDEVLVC